MSAKRPDAAASDGTAMARTLMLNALRDLCGGPRVVADESSRTLLRERFEATVDAERRERFAELAKRDDEPTEEEAAALVEVAGDVLDALAAEGVDATLVHRASLSVPPREAALYTFTTTHDPAVLADLDLPEAVRDSAEAGARALADGNTPAALERFEAAVETAGTGAGGVSSRVLAAYAAHRAGEDDAAIDYVEEALHLETAVWPAKLVGYAADARRPQKYRDGKLGARAFFRWATDVPDDGSVDVAVGPTAGSDGADGADDADADGLADLTGLVGRPTCMPLDRLWPETTFEVRVGGTLPTLPTVEAYYVALGVVDREVHEARTVEQILLSGPAGVEATETVRFERSADADDADSTGATAADRDEDGDGDGDA